MRVQLLKRERFDFKPDHIAAGLAELHADQMDRLTPAAVFVGIAPILDLLQGTAFGFQFDHLEFENLKPARLKLLALGLKPC